MRSTSRHNPLRRLPLATLTAALALAALTLGAPAARGDDRSLLHATQQNPYVFIILDTSGSMHQEISCTATDKAAGVCSQICDPGDCLPRMMGDDPDSKLSVAKQSIYAIMATHPNINFGFGHFDQTQLQVLFKYWYYRLASTSPGIALDPILPALTGTLYPLASEEHLFGQQAWACTDGGFGGTTFNQVGCNATHPAHLDNAWEYERVRRYPKLGDDNTKTFVYYIQEKTGGGGPTYKITFAPPGTAQVLGAPTLQASVKVEKCTNAACSTTALKGTQTMTFNLANQTVYWDTPVELNGTNIPDASGNGGNFYGGNPWTAREVTANYSNANHQLDPNSDEATNDPWALALLCKNAACDMQQHTVPDPAGRNPANTFSIGDIIPLDWNANQQTLIQQRMAPNLLNPANTVPDFSISSYLVDHRLTGDTALELKDATQRPLAPEGGTPTGTVMMSFANLMTGSTWPVAKFNPQALGAGSSWIGTASAATGDPFFSCKTAYVLLLTDGLASSDDGDWTLDKTACPIYSAWNQVTSPAPGFACCAAEALRSVTFGPSKLPFPIRTYVIGLGLTTTTVGGYNNTLQCIADEGGTGNRHFFNGNPNTVAGQPKGFPAADPPGCCSTHDNGLKPSDPDYALYHCAPVTPCFCCSAANFAAGHCDGPVNPCDGPGPILPRSKTDVVTALQTVLNLIQSQATAFASAAVPSIQSNVQNKSIITSFLPINQPIWPGRVDAYADPIPTHTVTLTLPDGSTTTANVPDPSQQCTTPGQQGCHLWNAGDQILAQGQKGLDTTGTDATKRRVYYAPAAPIAGFRRLFLQLPPATDASGQLVDLENALGICGPGYNFNPPSAEACTENAGPASTLCAAPPVTPVAVNPCPTPQTATTAPYTTASSAVTFAEQVKSFLDPATNATTSYLLGDIFHSDPLVLGQPTNVALFDGNVDNYQAYAGAERFRRKVLFFGSNDGELHAIDAGTAQPGTVAQHTTWVFSNGTGNELFAFVPRTVLPTLNQLTANSLAGGGSETFMVDGPPHVAEGFFDATGVTNPCPMTSPPAACQWHSVVIGGLREGGRGYYAVDVTQPDTLTPKPLLTDCPKVPPDPTCTPNPTVQIPNPTAATYLPNCIGDGSVPPPAGCGQLPYPTPLWEFADSVKVNPACNGGGCQLKPNDEDPTSPPGGAGVNQPDLGQAWSRPNSGRVRICDTSACTTFHEQWVVVFGGGMDPNAVNSQGNWLYMLDMANGNILYKRLLNGSVPSEPAAVDTGQDGYIDTLYVGTTAGHLYKIDLSQPAPIDSVTKRVTTSFWVPFEIFDTEGRQMFYPPAVFFDADLNQYGLAWGTGDRQDLWKCAGTPSTCTAGATDLLSGRFYVMIDRDKSTGQALKSTSSGLPFKAANLQPFTPDAALAASNANFLLSPGGSLQNGWYLDLKSGERVLTEAFALSGVLIFSSYQPQVVIPLNSTAVCADTGDTRVFLLNIDNANPISAQVASQGTGTPGNGPGGVPTNRYLVLSKDLGLNINTSESTPIIATKDNPNPPQPPALSAAMKDVLAQIKLLMPSNCRFTAKRINITVSDTFNVQHQAGGVPECIIEKNWKEF